MLGGDERKSEKGSFRMREGEREIRGGEV